MKKMKYLLIIMVISLLAVFGISYSLNGKEKEFSNNDFKIKYDSTWKAVDKKQGIKLKHRKTDSVLNIQCKILESNYIDTKLSDIISDIVYSIEMQNTDYKLINKLNSSNDEYESYSYLYENNDSQALVTIYKKDNKLVIVYYNAQSEYFDIVLDSVDNILSSIEIITGELIN